MSSLTPLWSWSSFCCLVSAIALILAMTQRPGLFRALCFSIASGYMIAAAVLYHTKPPHHSMWFTVFAPIALLILSALFLRLAFVDLPFHTRRFRKRTVRVWRIGGDFGSLSGSSRH